MKVLAARITNLGFLTVQLVVGILFMALAIIGLPVATFCVDATLMESPYVLGVVIISALGFAIVAFFALVNPYILCRKCPEIQAETDGEFLYIHANKEAKIPLSSLSSATVRTELPFLYQEEFLREIILHLFSEEYGDLVLDIPDHGTYKMRFIAHAQATANDLIAFIDQAINAPNSVEEIAQ